MLCEAYDEKIEWPDIFDLVNGMIFLSTPFCSADGMSQSEMLEAAVRLALSPRSDSPNDMITALKPSFNSVSLSPQTPAGIAGCPCLPLEFSLFPERIAANSEANRFMASLI